MAKAQLGEVRVSQRISFDKEMRVAQVAELLYRVAAEHDGELVVFEEGDGHNLNLGITTRTYGYDVAVVPIMPETKDWHLEQFGAVDIHSTDWTGITPERMPDDIGHKRVDAVQGIAEAVVRLSNT